MNTTFQLRYDNYNRVKPLFRKGTIRLLVARMNEHNYLNKIIVSFVLLNLLALFDYGLLSTRVIFTGDIASTSIAVLIRKSISYNILWIGACVIYWNIKNFNLSSKTQLEKIFFHVIHCLIITFAFQVAMAWLVSTSMLPNPYFRGTMLKAFFMGVTGFFYVNILFYIGIISLGKFIDNKPNELSRNSKGDSLTIKDPGRILFLKKNEIKYIKSEQNYVAIYTRTQNLPILTRKTMREIQISIESPEFVRVHRSYIVNKYAIAEIIRNKNGMDHSIKLLDQTIIPMSRSNRSKLFEQIQ
ncbi:MAG: LytTR family transcriptional regulator DNA-binding domain-containing protein [Cyclobacteriaceae bacterium]